MKNIRQHLYYYHILILIYKNSNSAIYMHIYFAKQTAVSICPVQVTSSTYACGKSLLTLLAALFPFMDRGTIEDFPYNMTELIELLPVSLCTETVGVLCDHILPFILSDCPDSPCKGSYINYITIFRGF